MAEAAEVLEPEDLNQKIKLFLKDRGYEIIKKLGEGNTRETYLAQYNSGNLKQFRVVKIPKSEIDESSICTVINLSKRDVNDQEVVSSNRISHPNIVTLLDSFYIDGKTINVEEYFEADDLEHLVSLTGPLRNEKFEEIFSQAIKGMKYLNIDEKILHRDIKPSNTLVNRNKVVKISDLQNCTRIFDIKDNMLPTRGGTPYTHPDLLNALVGKRRICADEGTETYALGATMFYALTGKNPFGYNIEIDPEGKDIEVGDRVFKVALKDGEKVIETIDKKEHEARLKKELKNIPKKYRDIIYKCLTLDSKEGYNDIYELESDFEESEKKISDKIKSAFIKSIKPALIGMGAAGVIGLFTAAGMHAPKQEAGPTLAEILTVQDYRNFNLETLNPLEKNCALDILVPYMEMAERKLPELPEKKRNFIGQVITHANHAHKMPKRLISAWMKANLLFDKEDIERAYKDERVYPGIVPKLFILVNDPFPRSHIDDYVAAAFGTMYLKQNLDEKNIADVFAEYYCSNEELHTARAKGESLNYFPRVNEKGVINSYGQYLPYLKSELINTAVALYLITDEEGNTDFSKIPELNFLKGQYKSQLFSFR